MPKRTLTPFILLLAGLFTTTQALEIGPLAEIQLPAKTNIAWEKQGKKDDTKFDSDIVFEVGSEFLWYTNYIRYGAGLAYKSPLKKGSTTAAPGAIPVWLSTGFGLFNRQAMVQPYAVARFGTLAPLSGDGNWWESPLNFFVSAGAGAIFPYGIGLEVVYDYSSVKKSFKSDNTEFRVSTGRVGIQLSVGFELGGTTTSTNNSGDQVTYETTFQDPYEELDQATSTPSQDSTASATQPEPDSVPAEEPSEPQSEPDFGTNVPTTEEPVSEPDTASTVEPVEETPAEPEAVSEPEPEPEAAPAPVEEPKPAAKTPAKKATKKAAKKPAKKANKKSAKSNKKSSKKKK